MAKELAFVLINPYTIAKSRTGGVIARYIARTDLTLVGARMFGPCAELVERYADLVARAEPESQTGRLISDYIRKAYAPNPSDKRTRRVMLLLFEGEDAIRKIWEVTGNTTLRSGSGQTIRDTYGDYVLDEEGRVQYFEPAVLVAPSRERAKTTLSLWAEHSDSCGGLVKSAMDIPETGTERTLVMLKPDNFRFRSLRPGNIIDVLSMSGLRIIGVRKFHMTVAQAEDFYGPVRESLQKKFRSIGGARAGEALYQEFGFRVPSRIVDGLCDQLGPLFAQGQFEEIVEFMTGYRPSACCESERKRLGKEECLALVYEGPDAVRIIRGLLGPTDPSKAAPGSVRREFGSNIMVNAAHASDSVENAKREMGIIGIEQDTVRPWVKKHYGGLFTRMLALGGELPHARCRWTQKHRGAGSAGRPGHEAAPQAS